MREKDITSVHVKMYGVARMHAIYSNDNKGVVTPISTILELRPRLLPIYGRYRCGMGVAYISIFYKKIHAYELLPQS